MADEPRAEDTTTDPKTDDGEGSQPDGMNPHVVPDGMNPHTDPAKNK